MLKTRSFGCVVLILCVLTMAMVGESFAAGDVVSPVIDRILAKKELVVGTAATMPPLNMTTKDGKIIGYEPDLAAIFADAMGVKLTMKPMRFSDLLPALQAGKVDMILSGMTMTPKRNLTVAFCRALFPLGQVDPDKAGECRVDEQHREDEQARCNPGSLEGFYERRICPESDSECKASRE